MNPVPPGVCVLFTFWSVALLQSTDAKDHPHVIYILADDLGWNDVSYHGSDQIPTPNIDSLAYQGVMLNHHYVQPVCTPSRASLMTGKHPIHTGQHWPYGGAQRSGLPLSEKIMPEYFKEMGYATHIVGKWHLGFYKKQFTPLQRGFDSHFGYWVGAISYYDHIYEDQNGLCGYDMRRNYTPAWDVAGQYTTDVFTREALRVIEDNPPDTPLFLLVTHLAVHAGNPGKLLEAPQEDINRFWYISDPNRRTYAAMVSKLDQSVGEIVEALGRKGMLSNAIIVFLSDNGSPNVGHFNNWGSNHPWRGQKATLFEGGVRTACLVWSPLITKPSRLSTGLMHITDWLPTLLSAAGYKKPLPDIDGMDQWAAISNDLPSPRDTVLLDIYDSKQMNGIIMGPYKYIHGATAYPDPTAQSGYLNVDSIYSKKTPKYNVNSVFSSKAWVQIENVTRKQFPTSEIISLRQQATISCEEQSNSSLRVALNCDDSPCLFNLADDPCERNNIAVYYPLLRLFMEVVLRYYKAGAYPEDPEIPDLAADPDRFNGTWSIWVT